MKTITEVKCQECGSQEIYFEAQVYWDKETAEWEASEPHYCLCHKCDEPVSTYTVTREVKDER